MALGSRKIPRKLREEKRSPRRKDCHWIEMGAVCSRVNRPRKKDEPIRAYSAINLTVEVECRSGGTDEFWSLLVRVVFKKYLADTGGSMKFRSSFQGDFWATNLCKRVSRIFFGWGGTTSPQRGEGGRREKTSRDALLTLMFGKNWSGIKTDWKEKLGRSYPWGSGGLFRRLKKISEAKHSQRSSHVTRGRGKLLQGLRLVHREITFLRQRMSVKWMRLGEGTSHQTS